MTTPAPVLIVRHARREHTTDGGTRVGVHDISFDLHPGQWTALLGPNGSGKSTLLRLISTADWTRGGEIRVGGVRVRRGWSARERSAARRAIGVVFQSPALDPLLTVRENLLAASALLGLGGGAARDRVEEVTGRMGLGERATDRVGRLSGGLRRRADLARALLGRPALLILDEPTTGLDPESRESLLALLGDLRMSDHRPAILFSTHLTEEAERADRVLIIDRGHLVADASPSDLRRALGDRVLTIEGAPRGSLGLLAALGLNGRKVAANRVLATGTLEELERLALDLAGEGRAFSLGPVTLADAYAVLTASDALADRGGEVGA
jgi:ABC-2 type transport system ATP-binding protein